MKKHLTILFLLAFVINTNAQESITNGVDIEIQDAPYQVSIYYEGKHNCGGSIINNRYVLTAAHCLEGRNLSDLSIKAGITFQNNHGDHVQSFQVKRQATHPNYNIPSINNNDVGILEIDGEFTFNDHVQPIELISDNSMAAESVGNIVRVSGWGWTEPGTESHANQLQAVNVPIIDNTTARDQLVLNNLHIPVTENMIATGANGQDRQGACHLDSGGPLTSIENGRSIQLGIVSWGVPGCVGGEDSPSIYARVSQLSDWINSQVWNHATIGGDDEVCYATPKTYTIENVPSFINVAEWEVSPNLTISSSNNNAVTLSGAASNSQGNAWIKAHMNNGGIVEREIWVGKPNRDFININKNTAYNLSSSVWNWIQADYNNSYFYNVGTWEWRFTPSSGVNISTMNGANSSIHVRPSADGSLIIEARVSNDCGCSLWKGKEFQIGSGSGPIGTSPGLEW